jgi:hypothetical protein
MAGGASLTLLRTAKLPTTVGNCGCYGGVPKHGSRTSLGSWWAASARAGSSPVASTHVTAPFIAGRTLTEYDSRPQDSSPNWDSPALKEKRSDAPPTLAASPGGRKSRQKASHADPAQSRRFVETARELGCDEDPEAFKRAVEKLVKAPPAPRARPKPKKAGDKPA